MKTVAEKIISFCKELEISGSIPEGISILNPFRNDSSVLIAVTSFYKKYYSDIHERHLILGINPGRFGAGITGIPFTDTVRLQENCGLSIPGLKSFETSSVFIYEMIDQYGGPEKFYSDFLISSVSPLGFTSVSSSGREINYNYYDNRELAKAIRGFAIDALKKQLGFGIKQDVCFCLGTGQNFKFLSKLNNDFHFFSRIVPLEHPRYIMQYRTKQKQQYISKYLAEFRKI